MNPPEKPTSWSAAADRLQAEAAAFGLDLWRDGDDQPAEPHSLLFRFNDGTDGLTYIAESKGGFHPHTIEIAQCALAEIARLRGIIAQPKAEEAGPPHDGIFRADNHHSPEAQKMADDIARYRGHPTPSEIASLEQGCCSVAVREWRGLSDDAMRLRCGEMTAQEIRTVRAVLDDIIRRSEGGKPR